MKRTLLVWLALSMTLPALAEKRRYTASEPVPENAASVDAVGPQPVLTPVAPPTTTTLPAAPATEALLTEIAKESKLLNIGARIDASFVGGGTVNQGFAIPGLRLAAYGDVGKHLNYRLTLGQTREFASVLLPQLLPVEAFINLSNDNKSASHVHWRIGIFRPSINPWWTTDLANISIPDYNEIHKVTLFANDIGTEFSFQPIADRIEITLGAFNGNGVFSLNSNNTKAFAGLVRGVIPIGEGRLDLGTGAYGLFQGVDGSINYRQQWVLDVFAALEYAPFSLWVDYVYGNFNDSLREVRPAGFSLFGTFEFTAGWKIFGRYENLQFSPVDAEELTHVQFGPLWELDNALRVFVFYQGLKSGNTGTTEKSAQVRVRLSL